MQKKLIKEHAKNCMIGANSVILKDTKENGSYLSSPTEKNRIASNMLKHVL